MKIQITQGRVIDPANRVDKITDLCVEQSKIISIGKPPPEWKADRVLDAKNKLVIPGLIDLAVCLREPGHEHKATIYSETYAAASAGVTTLVCLPCTKPVIGSPAEVELVLQLARDAGFCNVHVIGATTAGLQGKVLSEMAALKAAGCVGVSNVFQPFESTLVLRRAMEYAASHNLIVFYHPLDTELANQGCIHEGATATRLGLPGIPVAAETAAVSQLLALIEQIGVRVHFCRITTARATNMIARARFDKLPVSADASILHLFFTDTHIGNFDSNYHALPPFRTKQDRSALHQGLKNHTLSAICSDHQPHELEAKLSPFPSTEPGVSCIEMLLPLTLKLVHQNVLDLATAISLVTNLPAQLLGINAGTLGLGATADICICDPQHEWLLTNETLRSRGKNTPLLGTTIKGRVTHTLRHGKVVYEL